MRRREFITLLGGAAAWPLAAQGQQLGKRYRIGVLSPEAPPPGLLEAFEEGLRELGYVQRENVNFEVMNAGGDDQRLMELANELVRVEVDVILAVNTPAVQAAKKATQAIPIVMTRVADPIKLGIVPSLSHPSGNITGLNFMPDELSGKRLQMLKEIFPGLSHVAVLWYGANPGTTLVVHGMEAPSRELSIKLLLLPVNGPDDFFKAFETKFVAPASRKKFGGRAGRDVWRQRNRLASIKAGVAAVREYDQANVALGSNPDLSAHARMSPSASCGHDASWHRAAMCQSRSSFRLPH